jgi:hypothetical protein
MTMIQMRSMRGLGNNTLVAQTAVSMTIPAPAGAVTMAPDTLTTMQNNLAPNGGGPSLNPPGTEAQSEKCACMADTIAQHAAGRGVALPAEAVMQLATACMASPATIEQAAKQVGANIDSCKPWYQRRITWIVGGLAAAGVGAYVLLGR